MKKGFKRAVLAATAAVLMAPAAGAVEFNASVWFPDTHPLTREGYIDWAEAVIEASNGELTPVVFTGTALLSPNAHLSGLRDGIIQVGYHAGTYTPSELPEDNVLAALQLGLSDPLVTVFAVTDFYLNDPDMQAMFARNGIVFGGGYASAIYRLMCTSKIETLQDMRGKKIRMPGAIHSEWGKSVGAVSVNVPSSEMFTGLEKGQIDCAVNAANDLKSRSLWDVAKHITLVNFGPYWAGWEYAFNKDFWQSLTPEQRRILLDTIAAAIVKTSIVYQAVTDQALDEAPGQGVTIHEPSSDLVASLEEFASTTAREIAIQQGKEQFRMADPEALIERFEATVAKWSERLAGVDRTDEAALTEIMKSEIYDKIDVATYGVE